MAAMTAPMLPQPTQGDVLELILADHGTFEDLLRECRRTDRDRAAARTTLAELLVAHAEAEESEVYPTLRAKRAIGAEKDADARLRLVKLDLRIVRLLRE
jgi:hemerythrin superfamily protein